VKLNTKQKKKKKTRPGNPMDGVKTGGEEEKSGPTSKGQGRTAQEEKKESTKRKKEGPIGAAKSGPSPGLIPKINQHKRKLRTLRNENGKV